MLFFKKGVLSDKDILKLLGKDIFIYPFQKKNLKASSYNLTASIFAYKIVDDEIEKNGKKYITEIKKSLVNEKKQIVIEKHTTALIQTNESIYVSNKICGTYHSKVSLCIKGLSHIGTTLDPCYFGTSLIAVHNNSEDDIKINVGDTFVSLMFYALSTKSKCLHNNLPFRTDLQDLKIEFFNKEYLNKQECKGAECSSYEKCRGSNVCGKKIEDKYISIKNEIKNEMKKWINEEWRSNLDELKAVVKNDKLKMNEHRNIKILESTINIVIIISIIALIGYIWIGNFEINSTQYKIIISLLGLIPVILKGLETSIKNLLRGE